MFIIQLSDDNFPIKPVFIMLRVIYVDKRLFICLDDKRIFVFRK